MKKILLIGASGNLGSTIIKSKLFKNITFPSKKKLNLLNKNNIKNYLNKKFDLIINCSGYPRIRDCENNALKSFELNYLTVKNLIDEIKIHNKNLRLIHISTDAVYGSLKGNYLETDNYNPKTFYGVCKVLSELQVKGLNNYCIIRTRFFSSKKFLYKNAATDIFSSMIEIQKLAKVIYGLSFSDFKGTINVGEKRESDYSFLKKYFKKLKKTSRGKIQRKKNFFITKDASLNLQKFDKLKIRI